MRSRLPLSTSPQPMTMVTVVMVTAARHHQHQQCSACLRFSTFSLFLLLLFCFSLIALLRHTHCSESIKTNHSQNQSLTTTLFFWRRWKLAKRANVIYLPQISAVYVLFVLLLCARKYQTRQKLKDTFVFFLTTRFAMLSAGWTHSFLASESKLNNFYVCLGGNRPPPKRNRSTNKNHYVT